MPSTKRRCRCPRRRVEAGVAALVFGLAALAGDAVSAPAAIGFLEDPVPLAPGDEELFLSVALNRSETGRIARFLRRDGVLQASVATLRGLGFALPGEAPAQVLPLQTLPGLAVRYDDALQRIELDAPLALLDLATTRLAQPATERATATAAPGALLNYDVYASRQREGGNLTASSELRVFGVGGGVFSNTAVARTYRSRDAMDGDAAWHNESVRLDTRWTASFPDSAVAFVAGDAITGVLPWTRAVRLGGVQLARNYALQPYRITTPLPSFLGEATLPSSVELYVDGIRQYSGEVPAGPFQLNTVPGIDGAGNARLVVTDAFGAVRTLDVPFYATQQLLAAGLSDWSLSAGVIREEYGLRSFAYDDTPVANAQWRGGLSDRFTLEAHGEGGGGLVNAGVGGGWLLGAGGVFTASHVRSRRGGASGSQSALGYRWNNGRFQASLDSQRTHGDYRDIASLAGAPPPRISERALAGVVVPALGNISVSYLRLAYPGGEDNRYAGAFWSRTAGGGWSAYLSFNQNLDDSRDRSAYLGLSIALDGRRQLGTSLQRNGERTDAVADYARAVPADNEHGGLGWRVQARGGDAGSGGLAELAGFNDVGRYAAGVALFDGSTDAYASASGSATWIGGHVFAHRNISDAFALVSTDGVEGVPVRLENRVVGRTDADGLLLVAPLLAWQHNRIAIDPMHLPVAMRIDAVEQLATPRERSGTQVRFVLEPVRAALVVLHDADGQPLPLGSRVRLDGGEGEAFVGYDGEVYLDRIEAHNVLRVFTGAGPCSVAFDSAPDAAGIPRIGPLRCLPTAAL